MPSMWDTGMLVRQPSWHRLENLLEDYPGNWAEARKAAGLDWDVVSDPIFINPTPWDEQPAADDIDFFTPPGDESNEVIIAENYQGIFRNDLARSDPAALLAVQSTNYKMITIAEFGEVIEEVLGFDLGDDPIRYEGAFSLYGGKAVLAVVYFEEPLMLGIDSSTTYRYVTFVARHDGNGGLRGIPTNVRVVCANTLNAAEMTDGKRVGFTIRHTANWQDRVADMRQVMIAARAEGEAWTTLATKLAGFRVRPAQVSSYLAKFLPTATDMGDRQLVNNKRAKEAIRSILLSSTCTDIAQTGYGLVMASTEWADHVRQVHTDSSYVNRQLMRKEPMKARSVRLVKQMAGIRGSG